MRIVIPMAGGGTRFRDAGYDQPKPLIDVLGRPMYTWALDSLPLHLASKLVFICRSEDLDDRGLADDIGARYGDLHPEVIGLDHLTDGQLCTVLEAGPLLDVDEPVLVYNADTFARSGLGDLLTTPTLPDGILTVFEAEGDHWSFARVDDAGRVIETAEKRRISPWATTGLYWFRDGRTLIREGTAMVRDDDRSGGEFYVAPLYNRLIARGADVRIDVATEIWPLGTPAELDHFLSVHRT